MELLFAHIRKQGVLNNIGLSFSPYYIIHFDEQSRTLHISENDNFPKNFFNSPILSITGIVGNNGAGKSTAVYWLLKALVDGSGEKEPDGIIVLKDNQSGKLSVYTGENFRNIRIKTPFSEEYVSQLTGRFTSHIPCCYYSGHFSPYTHLDVDSGELSGETNISDKWLLIKDYQNFTASDSLHLNHPLSFYLNAHVSQDAYRITHLLMDRHNREQFIKQDLMRLPEYIVISPNRAGRAKLIRMSDAEKDSQIPFNYTDKILDRHIKYPDSPEQELVNSFIIESFINYIAENLVVSEDTIKQFWKWVRYPSGQDALQDLTDFIVKTKNQEDFFLSNLVKVLDIVKYSSRVYNSPNPFFYLTVEESELLRDFSESLLHSTIFLTCRFFDLNYTIDLESQTKLSSGERAMLNILSRIYWYLTIDIQKFQNLDVPAMLFLDEAEIGFHPDWQRKYLYILTRFLDIFYNNLSAHTTKPVRKFQIIYTTHSPISLADLPKECVNFLERTQDGVVNRSTTMPQTFGENVFELYRHSFFMKDGLMGKMAEQYIKDIVRTLDNELKPTSNNRNHLKTNRNELKKQIEIIGDRRIRNYLLEKYAELADEDDLDSRIAIKRMELEQLEELKRHRKDYEEN